MRSSGVCVTSGSNNAARSCRRTSTPRSPRTPTAPPPAKGGSSSSHPSGRRLSPSGCLVAVGQPRDRGIAADRRAALTAVRLLPVDAQGRARRGPVDSADLARGWVVALPASGGRAGAAGQRAERSWRKVPAALLRVRRRPHVLDTEFYRRGLRELVCYADEWRGVVPQRGAGPAAQGRYARSRCRWGLVLHPDGTNLAGIISFLNLGGGFCPAVFDRGLERGVVAFVLVSVFLGEVGDRLVELG